MNSKVHKNSITWDLVLFFALYIVMPEYFAFEISGSLPLITASRAVFVLLGLMMVIRRRSELFKRSFSLKNWKLVFTEDPVLRWGMLGYFVLLIITNLALLFRIPSAAVKQLFVIVAEQYGLVWLLTMTIDSREKLKQCLQVLAYASGIVAAVASVGIALDVNFFHYLNTTQRDMLMATYYRLGMLRAEAGFGHPVFYGAFCAVILPVCMYFLEESEKKWDRVLLSCCVILNLLGLILSNSRGSLIAFIALLVLMIPIKLVMRIGKKNILNYLAIIVVTAVALVAVTAASPAGTAFLQNMTDSIIVVIKPEQTEPPATNPPATEPPATEPLATNPPATEPPVTEPPATEPVVDYGENTEGLRSRLVQLTGIEWTLKHRPIFGFGHGAQNRGELAYEFEEGRWWATGSVDVGLVSVIGQYGIVGLIGYCLLYGSVLLTLLRKKMWQDKLMMMFFYCFTGIVLCLLSIASMDKTMWVLIALFVCTVNLNGKKRQESNIA